MNPILVGGRYRLGASLGSGGQGHTFAGTDIGTSQPVAIKVIRLRGSDGWKPFDLFERECTVLKGLDHPGIPRFIATFADEDAGTFYLVMERIEGRPLSVLQRENGSLAEAQLWNTMHQVLAILTYLHHRGPPLIHRDVKPANLIQRPNGTIALVDFGGVRVALREDGGSTVVGTFGYMAPEQLHGEATAATDIYGLGATLAALSTGTEADKLPHRGLAIDLSQVMPPGGLRDVLAMMLVPDPNERLGTVEDVQRAINAGLTAQRGRGRARRPTPPRPAPPAPPHVPFRDDPPGPLEDTGRPLSFVLRVLGTVGYVGLTVLDAIVLPLIFAMLSAIWSKDPRKAHRLEGGKELTRTMLRGGRRAMRALAHGRNPYQLGDGSAPRRQFPPPRNDPPPPPPGRPRGRRGRRR